MSFLKKVAKKIIGLFPLRNVIVFESRPDYSDNTFMVFQEMVSRGIDKTIKMVWLCFDSDTVIKNQFQSKNIICLNVKKHKIRYAFYRYFARVTICCNRFIGSDSNKQKSFYLMHGSPIKDTTAFYKCPDYIKWMITASNGMLEPSAKGMCFDSKKCVALGFPRNDIFHNKKVDLSQLFGSHSKYIAWLPTVKQYKNGFNVGNSDMVSFISNPEKAKELHSLLSKLDIVLIIKTHFAQVDYLKTDTSLSNIIFINNSFLNMNGLDTYSFLTGVDALLTDYSSVYYDFLLCDKPVGFVWDDIELFKKELGVVDGFDSYTRAGEKIYSLVELKDFIIRINDNVYVLKKERKEVCSFANFGNDGLNSKRVCDFILNECGIAKKTRNKK